MSIEAMKQLREVHAIQGRKGCYDISDYMLGMFNGLELALCIMESRAPQYKERQAIAEAEKQKPMHPELKKMWEDYFDKCFATFAKGHEAAFNQAIAEAGKQEPAYRCCPHDSDCAVHNMPAYPAGPCDCTYKNTPPKAEQEPVASAWDEGYQAGINDERISEANIGIAGFGAKVEPARNNPYRTHPQPKREWVGLTEDEMNEIYKTVKPSIYEFWKRCEALLKEKNT